MFESTSRTNHQVILDALSSSTHVCTYRFADAAGDCILADLFTTGKGFYGRYLANAWNVPLFSASKILRQSSISTDTGRLVDCETVSTVVLQFLKEHVGRGGGRREHLLLDDTVSHDKNVVQDTAASTNFFLMDGFPRTRQQIDFMNQEWPTEYRITTAFRLDVPDSVCAQKIAGRRVCQICHHEPNTANVATEGFVLPPTIPIVCQNRCDPAIDWVQRVDDSSDEVIAQRLRDYREHEQPLIDYYKSCSGLCSFTPYFGAKDVPKMQQTIEQWFATR